MSAIDLQWLSHLMGRFRFVLFNADMIYPLGLFLLSAPWLLLVRSFREQIRSPAPLILFCFLPLLWIMLIPWGAAFLGAMDGPESPPWAMWIVGGIFWGWPFVAAAFIHSAKGARGIRFLYLLFNLPGWLWGSFIAAMAVSGDWI